jgi:hypothetical protein
MNNFVLSNFIYGDDNAFFVMGFVINLKCVIDTD